MLHNMGKKITEGENLPFKRTQKKKDFTQQRTLSLQSVVP